MTRKYVDVSSHASQFSQSNPISGTGNLTRAPDPFCYVDHGKAHTSNRYLRSGKFYRVETRDYHLGPATCCPQCIHCMCYLRVSPLLRGMSSTSTKQSSGLYLNLQFHHVATVTKLDPCVILVSVMFAMLIPVSSLNFDTRHRDSHSSSPAAPEFNTTPAPFKHRQYGRRRTRQAEFSRWPQTGRPAQLFSSSPTDSN